jgi:hypothetical protein
MSTSAAISVQEMPSPEGANACHFMVVYEDAAACNLAREVCGGVVARLESELAFRFSFWELKDLNDPTSARQATEALACADILLFSLPGHDLAPEAMIWLEVCAPARTKAEGALALVIAGPPGPNLAVEALLFQMHFAAHRLRMDFLPLLTLTSGGNMGTPLTPSLALLDRLREESGGDHWGLNE